MMTLVGGIVALMILVVAVDSLMGGLPGTVRTLYEQETSELEAAGARLSQDREKVEALVSSESDFLKAIEVREDWTGRFERAQQMISEAREVLDRDARPLFEKNDSEDGEKLHLKLQAIQSLRVNAMKEAETVAGRADKLVYYKSRREELMKEAEAGYKAISSERINALKLKATGASLDWPEKQADINGRMAVFADLQKIASESYDFLMAENQKADSAIDYDALISRYESLRDARDRFNQSIESVSGLLDELYVSWDKILADMEIREGYEVEFFHTYKYIKVDKDDQAVEEVKEQRVTKEYYLQQENNLGMTLESKPKGKYAFEADKQTVPAGYGYVDNPHYGRWERRASGGSFWVFYGQYALMRDLLWGRGYYRPVSRTDWDSYKQTRSSGRTYYGRDSSGGQVFGSKGKTARTRYAGSKYTTSAGYSGTQFKRTGGTYRGSKYATSSSSRSSRGFSSSSRGSRSFGGK
jgi:hypothetical protein